MSAHYAYIYVTFVLNYTGEMSMVRRSEPVLISTLINVAPIVARFNWNRKW